MTDTAFTKLDPFSPVHHCGRCHELMGLRTELFTPGPDWCPPCQASDPDEYQERVLWKSPDGAAIQQTDAALMHLVRPPDSYVEWPFQAMRMHPSGDMLPPLRPGSVNILAAASGLGKTAVTTSMVHAWVRAQTRVYVLPLELRASEWRVKYACHVIGCNPDDAISGKLRLRESRGDLNAKATREQIARILRTLGDDKDAKRDLYIASSRVVNVAALTRACQHAKALGFQIVLVDHIDHVGSDDDSGFSQSAIADSKAVLFAAARLAEDLDLILVLTSQLNEKIYGGNDLARYSVPKLNYLLLHTYKVMVSVQIWGIYRPLDPKVNAEDLKAAQKGELEAYEVLAKGRSGIAALKLRDDGPKEGYRAILAYEQGRIRDRTDFEIGHDTSPSGRPLL